MKSTHQQPICALTIAGSDSGGGAGIQADLKTFAALGVHGTSAITAITAQNTVEVASSLPISADMVQQQIEVVIDDLPIRAVKTGMLATADIVDAVATALSLLPDVPLVIDPVLVSSSGTPLLSVEGVLLMVERLIPLATIVTPNLAEAEVLLQKSNAGRSARAIAEDIMELAAGRAVVVLKGGDVHQSARAQDFALMPDGREIWLDVPRIDTRSTHGTGCTFAAAIAACLAKGMSAGKALRHAKHYVTGALLNARPLGSGHGPLDHMWNVDYTAIGAGPPNDIPTRPPS